ncbi:2-amino-4-hydroxy-6-hydroxymethyldihydropteridine diphosphokinase [Sphingomicrobium astaxanthinifaciens]|uniref:2-amino-4-hydroxy-6- hydroxymethyldihydropteridine diphosphokinase n=1 Tax=Sphingomicrobium astaxanthinifaciens TaxID=1227949 RepID=UPI001FCB4764|nr:2-amino-4-hydroxy-6-hydroxymethyldihydropteridine diphosphokinase [Sphingomicrobium astaxanthinifaciens]MCJ7422086.1 2-amino-4-hydroxy-6-hydroxymethyldihydropteridine diphosphokinase [Sphingomicrobium astaxanthinifaciens]
MTASKHVYGIGIGSNRVHPRHGRPAAVVEAAIARLARDHELFDASPILLNPAFGGAGRDFANAAAIVESDLEPEAMLASLKFIEHEFGRRPGKAWGPRVLDLDILAWDGGDYHGRALTIPHAALGERASALVPLAQIAPDWRITGGLALRHLAARLRRARRKN